MTVKKKQASKPNHARTLEWVRELEGLPIDEKLDVVVTALKLLTLALMKEARRSERLKRQVAKLKAAAKVAR